MELRGGSEVSPALLERKGLSEMPADWVAKDTEDSRAENNAEDGLIKTGSVADMVARGSVLREMASSRCLFQAVVPLGYLSVLVARTPRRGCDASHRGTDGC